MFTGPTFVGLLLTSVFRTPTELVKVSDDHNSFAYITVMLRTESDLLNQSPTHRPNVLLPNSTALSASQVIFICRMLTLATSLNRIYLAL